MLPMTNSRRFPTLGIYVYALAAALLGIIGLASADFATNWQRVPPGLPLRALLADAAALAELLGGAALLWRPARRIGAAALTALYSIFALLWLVQVCLRPASYDNWGNLFEESSLVLAGLAIFFASGSPLPVSSARARVVARIYGICVVSYGLDHFFYLKAAAGFVPQWIPPGQMFWVVTTAICFLLAAAAILTGILAGLATRLLTAEILGFEVLLWAPKLFASPHDHFMWSANGISLALAGAVWVVADVTNQKKVAVVEPQPVLAA